MAKVTFATREFVEKELEQFKSGIDKDLHELVENNTRDHEEIRNDITEMRNEIDEVVTKRIDEVEKNFNESLEEFRGSVEDDLDELSRNILVENIKYKHELYPGISNVKAALDKLLYFETEAEFTTSVNLVNEIGNVLNDVVFSWTYNKPSIVSQSINGTPIAKTNRSYKFPSPIREDSTVRLSYDDGVNQGFKELRFTFLNKVYYGALSDLSNDNIVGLTNTLTSSRERVITVNAEAGQHIVYAIPVRMGTPKFFVGGFEGGFVKDREVALTNTSGYTEIYAIWKSVRLGLGNTTITIK